MKLMIAVLIGFLGLSANASPVLAENQVPTETIDRVEFAPGLYGILHTENFEYVCDMETKEGSEVVKMKSFLDVNFSEAPGYRFAVGFVGGGTVAGVVGAEAQIVNVTRARCPGLCLKMTIDAGTGSTADLLFSEDPVSKVITLTSVEDGVSSEVGTCQKNEVP